MVLGHYYNTAFLVSPDLIHHYLGIRTNRLDSHLALLNLTELNLGPAAAIDFDARAIDVVYTATQHLGFGVDSLQVDADQITVEDVAVLNDASVVTFADDVHSALLEVGEAAVRHLHV